MAVLLVGYAGFHWYQNRKQTNLINLAQFHLAKSDPQKAQLCLKMVLSSNPNNLKAVRMMADLTSTTRNPEALTWRKRVVELNPESMEDKLSLAQTAMILGDFNSASNALASVNAAGQKTAAFQNVAGAGAEAAGRLAEAEAHYIEAARLDPKVPAIQVNLAKVRLQGTNESAKAESRTVLASIAADPGNAALCCVALRELIKDAARSQHLDKAVPLANQLVRQTNSTFNDQIMRLDLLKQTGNAGFKAALAEAQQAAVKNPLNINDLATWQVANTGLDSTLAWLQTLPMSIQTSQPATLSIAQCLAFKSDWAALRAWVEKQNWGNMEFIRHAFLARAMRELGLSATSETEWQTALTLTGYQEPNLAMLLKLVSQWSWDSKTEDLLWAIVNKYPAEQWANNVLGQYLFNAGRTRPLMMLYVQQLDWNPTNAPVKNNLTMCALLLDAQELKPHDLARSLFDSAPDNPSYISTYAFSLYLQKKNAEALKVIQKLNPEELKKPSNAGYYGLILKANGDPAKAKTYLNLAATAAKSTLLPEEKRQFDQARAGL